MHSYKLLDFFSTFQFNSKTKKNSFRFFFLSEKKKIIGTWNVRIGRELGDHLFYFNPWTCRDPSLQSLLQLALQLLFELATVSCPIL